LARKLAWHHLPSFPRRIALTFLKKTPTIALFFLKILLYRYLKEVFDETEN